jgi:hypothetical protein
MSEFERRQGRAAAAAAPHHRHRRRHHDDAQEQDSGDDDDDGEQEQSTHVAAAALGGGQGGQEQEGQQLLAVDLGHDGEMVLAARGGAPGLGNMIMAGSRRHRSMVSVVLMSCFYLCRGCSSVSYSTTGVQSKSAVCEST